MSVPSIATDVLWRVEAVLSRRIGLNTAAVGRESVRQAAELRRRVVGAASLETYVEQLEADEREQSELVEEVIVPESWFFRDMQPMECVREFVRASWKRSSLQPIRILSVPCSRGEEPYSLAISLLDLGLQPETFRVLGVDISARSLQRARTGRYGRGSLREQDPLSQRLQATYFIPERDALAVRPEVRAAVSFREANLNSPDFLSDESPFDIVFCRNLLIYFDEPSRARALAHLRRLLAPDGLLYVGNSEIRVASEFGFQPWSRQYLASFRHDQRPLDSVPSPATQPMRHRERTGTAPVSGKSLPTKPNVTAPGAGPKQVSAAPLPAAATARLDVTDHVQQARAAADRGDFDTAELHCAEALRQGGPNAEVYFWIGLVHRARGLTAEAESALRKALYLNPAHVDALWHMALLCESHGDAAGAGNFRRRAREALNAGGEADE